MTANKGKVLLQVQGLEKKFDDNQVLDGITTDICQGEVVAVIGPSGSGKSTFLRSLNLLEQVRRQYPLRLLPSWYRMVCDA